MLPILFRIPIPGTENGLPIRAFGLTAALAFLLGLWIVLREGRRVKLDPDKLQSIALWCFVGILGGSRLGFVLVNYEVYLKDPIKVFWIWEGGLVLYGGLTAAIALGMWQVTKLKMPFGKTVDLFFLGGMLGLSLARIGCICAGDDWGRVAPGLTLQFPGGTYVAKTVYTFDPLHPGMVEEGSFREYTDHPVDLYKHDGARVVPEGAGPLITYQGFCKKPCPIMVEIVDPGHFRHSTDGGKSFGAPSPIPPETTLTFRNPETGEDEDFTAYGEFTVPGTVLPWAIRFAPPKDPENLLDDDFIGEWLHPTQLYLSANCLLIFFILLWRQRTGKAFPGELITGGMMLYAVLRFIAEFYRGDTARGELGPLSTSQWVGIPFFLIGLFLYIKLMSREKRRKQRGAEAPAG